MSRPTLAALALLTLAAAQAGGALAADAPAATPETEAPAEASGQALTANLTLASQYRYRGLMQSNNKPAVQGGFDFTHASGFYLGNWNSSISWLNDGNDAVSAPVEMDFYGGYKGQLAPNVPVDLGVLQYYYRRLPVRLHQPRHHGAVCRHRLWTGDVQVFPVPDQPVRFRRQQVQPVSGPVRQLRHGPLGPDPQRAWAGRRCATWRTAPTRTGSSA